MSLRKATIVWLALALAGIGAVLWQSWAPRQSTPTNEGATVGNSEMNAGRQNPFLSREARDRGWPFIRGPDFDGRSPEIHLADLWPSDGPPVLWTRVLGQGYSAFTAAEDRVFTQYQTLAGQYVVCLDARTGETIWEYRYDWPYEAAGFIQVRAPHQLWRPEGSILRDPRGWSAACRGRADWFGW
jgi:outer membrane protein assembly factor BamB